MVSNKMKKIILVIVAIVLFLLIASYITYEITKQQIERITQERTAEITEQITEERAAGITEKIAGDLGVEDTVKATGQFSKADCTPTPTKRQFNKEPYYAGPLIDTHLHMPVATKIVSDVAIQSGLEDLPYVGDVPLDYIVCLFDSEGITKAFGFFIITNVVKGEDLKLVKDAAEEYPERFVFFQMPPLPFHNLAIEPAEAEKIFDDNPGLYKGYGELRFDFNLGKNAHPEDEYFLEMYSIADENDLIVQIHPKKGQLDVLVRLLEKYPDVIFLAHVMPDARTEIGRLMETHDNLYYSLDAEISSIFGYNKIQDNKGPTKEEYLTFIRENFDLLLDEALSEWKPIIEAHPDRFMWGTDRWYRWHFDQEVGVLVEELGRSFIGQLDPDVQEKFAYKNAEKLLEER